MSGKAHTYATGVFIHNSQTAEQGTHNLLSLQQNGSKAGGNRQTNVLKQNSGSEEEGRARSHRNRQSEMAEPMVGGGRRRGFMS